MGENTSEAPRAGRDEAPPPEAQQDVQVLLAGGTTTGVILNRVMPWVISVLFHAGLVLIMLFVTMIAFQDPIPKDVIVPDAAWVDNPGAQMLPSERVQEKDATRTVERRYQTSKNIQDNKSAKLAVVAPGAPAQGGERFYSKPALSGSGSSFFGTGGGGNVHNVVYVIDRSGSMVETFDIVRREILKSVGRLKDFQEFHVIMFGEGSPIEFSPQRLVPARDDMKDAVARFLEEPRVTPGGPTKLIPALMRAFDVLGGAKPSKPGKIIYLLTDGSQEGADSDFSDPSNILRALQVRNRRKDVFINTFLISYQPEKGRQVLEDIAKENSGKFKYVSPDE